jgi:putative lipoprotein
LPGRWLAEEIQGGRVVDRLQTVLEIAADGGVAGSGGCNRFAGRATISGDGIVFGRMAATTMGCAPARWIRGQVPGVRRASGRGVSIRSGELVLLDAEARPLVLGRM